MSGRLIDIWTRSFLDDTGRPVAEGTAQFYVTTTGWTRIPPGRLGVTKLTYAACSAGNSHNGSAVIRNGEFYFFEPSGAKNKNYLALNGSLQDFFCVKFSGTKY